MDYQAGSFRAVLDCKCLFQEDVSPALALYMARLAQQTNTLEQALGECDVLLQEADIGEAYMYYSCYHAY